MAILTLKQSYESAHAFLELMNPIINSDDGLKADIAESMLEEFWDTSGDISQKWKYAEIDHRLGVDDPSALPITPERHQRVLEAVYDLWGIYEKKWRPEFYDIHHAGVGNGFPIRAR
ncbi:hypothetical protein [Brucella anthropi]|uniref:hypothetical protein n=1 Tax=Brucella anthropi TaxID=529 RepID=UPI0012D32079|nr:hypothetical protein [Brucella anthropi]